MILSHRLFELGVKIELLKRQFADKSVAQTQSDIEAIQKEFDGITVKLLKANVPLELTLTSPIMN